MTWWLIHVYFEADDFDAAQHVQEQVGRLLGGTARVDLLEDPEAVDDNVPVPDAAF